jgi:hypothetical protein
MTISIQQILGSNLVGFTGSRGPAGGYTGSVGFVGSTGPAGGYTGSVGFVGSRGQAGGYTGSQGYQGNQGYTGSAGNPGISTGKSIAMAMIFGG